MTLGMIEALWNKACDHDGIEHIAKFVIFSENNPWAVKYNEAMDAFMKRLEKRVRCARRHGKCGY